MTTTMYPRRLLVAVDFSDASASAVRIAATLARAFGARLTVLHAETLDMPPYFTPAQIDTLEAERRHARTAAEDYLRRFVARETDLPVEALVVDGPPATAVLTHAGDFDLVVLGTHGRRGPRRWWLGSVAEAVLEKATMPVLVAHAGPDAVSGALRDGQLRVAVAGGASETRDRWVALFQEGLHATVLVMPDLATCDRDRLRDVQFVLIGLAGGTAAGLLDGAVADVLRACAHPALFVPESARASERTSS